MLVDSVAIEIRAGKGGDGVVSFRREKYVRKGGPDGGDGGQGGDVVFVASNDVYDLSQFRFKKLIQAADGLSGGRAQKTGACGQNTIIKVPVGTLVVDAETELPVADLVTVNQAVTLATGGAGGCGNVHFKSATNQRPLVAEKGLLGEMRQLQLELKLIAQVGLVGLPNAGKSTLLQAITKACPKIGAYPFTTLVPNLGVTDNDCLVADVPGLITGAATGKGLGHQFLRHVERCRVILHLIDVQQDDVVAAYQQIQRELHAYSARLSRYPQLVVLTKIDLVNDKLIHTARQALKTHVQSPIYTISALHKLHLDTLLQDVKQLVTTSSPPPPPAQPVIPVFRLPTTQRSFSIKQQATGHFLIQGPAIETLASQTDFNNQRAQQRLMTLMQRLGINQALLKAGYKNEAIVFGVHQQGPLYLEYVQGSGKLLK